MTNKFANNDKKSNIEIIKEAFNYGFSLMPIGPQSDDNVEKNTTSVKSDVWMVDVKGEPNEGDCEVSAVIQGSHGQLSWGWNDPANKIIVLSCSSMYMDYIDPRIVEAAKAVAMEIVNKKNASKEKDND